MKKSDIHVSGFYTAKIFGRLVTVRVDAIREEQAIGYTGNRHGKPKPRLSVYDVTNLHTGRKTTFRSAATFRSEATSELAKRQQGREGLTSTALEPGGCRLRNIHSSPQERNLT